MKKYIKELVVGCIFLLAFIGVVLFVFAFNPKVFDNAIYNVVNTLENGFFTTFFNIITTLANKYFTVIFVLILLFFLQNKNKSNYSKFLQNERANNLLNRFLPWLIYGIAVVVISILFLIIKAIFQRIRPIEWFLVEETGYSFPSGHTATATILYGLLNLLVIKSVDKRWIKITSWLISSLLILLIGISRIYLGVHYPTDVLGGLFLGIVVLCISNIFIKKFKAKIDFSKREASQEN